MTPIKETRSSFLQVRCDCGHEQVIFSRASSQVNCISCEEILAESTGGKIKLKGKVIQVLG
ncbi:MAG: 30S ribosomal protein S27e [Candidatus Hodarchaeota archaeon]